MKDQEVIKHLIEVEKIAEELLDDAKLRAEQKISEARSAAELKFKNESEKIIVTLEENYKKCCVEADELREKEIENFKRTLQNIPIDKPAAKKFLQERFFGES